MNAAVDPVFFKDTFIMTFNPKKARLSELHPQQSSRRTAGARSECGMDHDDAHPWTPPPPSPPVLPLAQLSRLSSSEFYNGVFHFKNRQSR
jgi:hypothetical protein